MQSKLHSMSEALVNVLSGMLIAFTIGQLAFHYEAEIQKHIWTGFQWHISAGSNLVMTTVLTIVSVVRGYLWRRHFNAKIRKQYETSEK
jgi:hypothetical protein